jgi:hypothetical protein
MSDFRLISNGFTALHKCATRGRRAENARKTDSRSRNGRKLPLPVKRMDEGVEGPRREADSRMVIGN